jgi:predicted Mrr-cat superfamily restriction endonuclease
MSKKMWVVRPEPNFVNRLELFLSKGMVAIGWPAVGDIGTLLNKGEMMERLCQCYKHYLDENKSELSVAAGILARFVNDIHPGDYVIVPDKDIVYLGEITGEYHFHPELNGDSPDQGYPHWHSVRYLSGKESFCALKELPLGVRRALDCHLTVFSVNKAANAMWYFLAKKGHPVDLGNAPEPHGLESKSPEEEPRHIPPQVEEKDSQQLQAESKTESHTESHAESHAESKTENKTENQTESHTESRTESQDERDSHVKEGHHRHQIQG